MFSVGQAMIAEFANIRKAYNEALVSLPHTTGQAATTIVSVAQTSSQAASQVAQRANQTLQQVQQSNTEAKQ